jgi:hypothetical protein
MVTIILMGEQGCIKDIVVFFLPGRSREFVSRDLLLPFMKSESWAVLK